MTATLSVSKLLKCLALTASNIDGEAVSAIRRANEMLDRHGLSWCHFIREGSDDTDWGSLIDEILARRKIASKWVDVLLSVKEHWNTKGSLSEKQQALVLKFKTWD